MSKDLAHETSYNLYRTLLENDWSVKQASEEDAYSDAFFALLKFLATNLMVFSLVPSFLMNLYAFMPSKFFAGFFNFGVFGFALYAFDEQANVWLVGVDFLFDERFSAEEVTLS